MRASPVIDALLSRTRQHLLAATFLQPERRWYQLELAQHLGVRASTLQRELKALTKAGLLKREQNGRRIYFQADRACPIFEELVRLLAKTVGLTDVLKEALASLQDRIALAFVYGSIAASAEGTASDIDLMIVGDVRLSEIAPVLRSFEPKLARPISPSVLTPVEFRQRVARRDHFLTHVLDTKPLFIIGGEHELADLASSAEDQSPPNESPRARRSARRS